MFVSKWPVNPKGLAVEWRGLKFETPGYFYNIYGVHLTFKYLRSFGGHSVHLSHIGLCIWKKACCGAKKRLKFGSRDSCNIWGIFDRLVFKVILGSFGAFVSKWNVTWKQLTVERNREILDPGLVVTRIFCAFDLLVFKVFYRSFGPLVSKSTVTGKRLALDRTRLKFGSRTQS